MALLLIRGRFTTVDRVLFSLPELSQVSTLRLELLQSGLSNERAYAGPVSQLFDETFYLLCDPGWDGYCPVLVSLRHGDEPQSMSMTSVITIYH